MSNAHKVKDFECKFTILDTILLRFAVSHRLILLIFSS